MKTKDRSLSFNAGYILASLVLIGASGYGWFANLFRVVHMWDDPVTAQFLLRVLGIFFPPLGVVLGYI
jgi:hypothetical protein